MDEIINENINKNLYFHINENLNENNILNLLSLIDYDTLDSFNKFSLLVHIFHFLIRKLKCQVNNNNDHEAILTYYDRKLTDFILFNKLSIHSENFNILFVDKEEIINSITSITNNYGNEDVQLKLLSLFEEEVRNFLKIKKEIIIKMKPIVKCEDTSDFNYTKIKYKLDEIYKLLIENFEITNDLFENFKMKEIQKEKNELNNIAEEIEEIDFVFNTTINTISENMTNKESLFVMSHIKNKLTQENKETQMEIELMKRKLKEYSDQGEELSELVKEYKKICNMIECAKIEKNK